MEAARVHRRSTHIDAPVAVVFAHVRDPLSFMAADPEPVRIGNVTLTSEGVGSTWESWWHVARVPMHAVWTREECVPDERIVDHVSTGMTWTYLTQPDATGTTLTIAYAINTRLAVANWILDHAFGNQDRQLDAMLASFKAAIEAPAGPGDGETGTATGAVAEPRPDHGGDVPQGLSGRVGVWLTPYFHGPMYPAAAAALRLQPDDDLLDVACGSGSFLATCARQVRLAAGVDSSALAVSSARKHLASRIADGTAEIVLGDAANLLWPDGLFSAVTCLGSLDLMPEPERVLSEMRRVLCPDGRAVFTMGSRFPDERAQQKYAAQAWCWTEEQLADALHNAGFAEPAIRYHRWGGRSVQAGLVNWFSRATAGTDEYRLVRTKPAGQLST